MQCSIPEGACGEVNDYPIDCPHPSTQPLGPRHGPCCQGFLHARAAAPKRPQMTPRRRRRRSTATAPRAVSSPLAAVAVTNVAGVPHDCLLFFFFFFFCHHRFVEGLVVAAAQRINFIVHPVLIFLLIGRAASLEMRR
jgi:hypothetical protein